MERNRLINLVAERGGLADATAAEAVTSGEYRQVVDMLPDDYRPLVSAPA